MEKIKIDAKIKRQNVSLTSQSLLQVKNNNNLVRFILLQ